MLYFYLVASAALIPVLDLFFDVLRESWSWWLVPVLYLGIFLCFLLLHLAVLCISVAFVKPDGSPDRGSGYYRKLVDLTLPLLFRLGRVHIHATGVEKVPDNTRFLLVCNHLHDFDPAVILTVLPDAQLGFIAKKEIYKTMPFISRIMHKLHCLPIDRENNREAVKAILSAVNLLKEDKASVGIFPEGYVSKSEELLPMRNGAFKIAYKAKVPVVICVIDGTQRVVKNMFRHRSDVYFDILDVIPAERLEEIHSAQLGEIVSELMQQGIAAHRIEK